MKCLQEAKQAQLVKTELPQYQKTGKGPGRPSFKQKLAESNLKMQQFFAPQQRINNNRNARSGGSSRGSLTCTSQNISQ